MGRDLEFAIEMINFTPINDEEIKRNLFCPPEVIDTQGKSASITWLGEKTSCFSVNKLEVHQQYRKEADSFYVGIVTKGKGRIDSSSQTVDIKVGDKFFCTCTKPGNYNSLPTEGLQLFFVFPPK